MSEANGVNGPAKYVVPEGATIAGAPIAAGQATAKEIADQINAKSPDASAALLSDGSVRITPHARSTDGLEMVAPSPPRKMRIDEEQEAAARKDARRGFEGEIFAITAKPLPHDKRVHEVLFVEAERWVDARAFGTRIMGVPEVSCMIIGLIGAGGLQRPKKRWQIRFAGSAGGSVELHMTARLIDGKERHPNDDGGWKDVRAL